MSILHQSPYTSILGDIQVPLDTKPLPQERQIQLQSFFTTYIEPWLTPTERKMIYDEGFCWLALADPDNFTKNYIIYLRPITTSENQNPETITCVIEGCVQRPEAPVLSYRYSGEETIRHLSRKDSGLYLFKIITDN